jgi:hypothetical protein
MSVSLSVGGPPAGGPRLCERAPDVVVAKVHLCQRVVSAQRLGEGLGACVVYHCASKRV